MTPFKLTKIFIINNFGIKLFQIELTKDCKWGTKGDKGGYLEKEENLINAWVSGNAQVSGDDWNKSPLQIRGTKQFVNMCTKKKIQIGCSSFELSFCKTDEFKKLGKKNGYTEEQLIEYGLYIDLAIKLYPSE